MGEEEQGLTEAGGTSRQARTWKTWQMSVAAGIAMLIGIAIGAAGPDEAAEVQAQADPESQVVTEAASSHDRDASSTTARPTTTTTVRPTTTTTEAPYFPAAADFQLGVVVTEQSCYGSAGCNVRYEVELTYSGPRALDDDSKFQLLYEITGTDDVKIGSIETNGGEYYVDGGFVSTPPNPQLAAVVTAVRER